MARIVPLHLGHSPSQFVLASYVFGTESITAKVALLLIENHNPPPLRANRGHHKKRRRAARGSSPQDNYNELERPLR